jgi:transcriptional regulator with XRE-family HTH domain
MASRDFLAAQLLRQRRIDRGLSPEGLSQALDEARLGPVSGRQIRRIEAEGIVPTPRVQHAIATFFATTPTSIWQLEPLDRSRVA